MKIFFQIGGFTSLLVASVIWVNGLWLLDKISKKSIVFINLFASFIILSTSIFSLFSSYATVTSIYSGTMTLLISCTYFWLAINIICNIDNMVGLGWFSLLVSASLSVLLISPVRAISSLWYVWNYFNWSVWCVLFFLYFLMIILKVKISKLIGYYSIFASVVNAFLPGFLALMTNIK